MTIYDEYEKTILKQISAYKEFGNFYVSDEAYKEIDLISLMEVLSYILPIQFYSKIDNKDTRELAKEPKQRSISSASSLGEDVAKQNLR